MFTLGKITVNQSNELEIDGAAATVKDVENCTLSDTGKSVWLSTVNGFYQFEIDGQYLTISAPTAIDFDNCALRLISYYPMYHKNF